MVRALIGILLICIVVPTATAEKSWVRDWWTNVYEQRLDGEQYEQIKQQETDRCAYKLRWYRDKVANHPHSEYYLYKLEQWEGKCPE